MNENAPLSHERYAGSPEYLELRGVSGNAVTDKAALFTSPRKKSLLFFLQALSLKPGGLKKIAADLVAMFPDRIGSPTMHRLGKRPGRTYDEADARRIERELHTERHTHHPSARPLCAVDELLQVCKLKCAHELDKFLVELCINPRLQFSEPGEIADMPAVEQMLVRERFPELLQQDFRQASVRYFDDVIGALFQFQERSKQAARESIAETAISRKVFQHLDRALYQRKMVVLDGEPGIGKTKAVETWCEMHLGEVRLVYLRGCVNRTTIFRSLAKALGLSSSYQRKAVEMQARVENMIERAGLMIIFDEAHFLFTHSQRATSSPELLDWLDTALVNHRVPAALCATPQFRERFLEAKRFWQSEQFERRAQYVALPIPEREDVEAVTRKLLPRSVGSAGVKLILGGALYSQRPLSFVQHTIDEARYQAQQQGRAEIVFDDLLKAVEVQATSEKAKTKALSDAKPARRTQAKPAPSLLQDPCDMPAAPLRSDIVGITIAENE